MPFFVHVVATVLYSHVIMAAISEAFPDITIRLRYSFYIPKSLLNSPLDNNIIYKSTEHYLNETCFSHRNTGFFLGKKAKLNVYAMSMPCTVRLMKRQRYHHHQYRQFET